jgi:general secretion pathway protein K
MVTGRAQTRIGGPLRSSVIVLVLVTLLLTAAALTAFIEKAGNDLLVEVRQADAKRLRQEAYSALEVTLATLQEFLNADGSLRNTAEGWGDPQAWTGWTPAAGHTVDISFQDESAKIPLKRADLTTLTNLFEAWQVAPADAAKLADAIAGWMQSGYVYSTSITPDYQDSDIPYAEPQRPLRSFSELAAIDVAKEFFFDENGLPNDYYWRFVNDVSLFNFPQPDVNGANSDVLAAVGQYSLAQQQQIAAYLAGTGAYANQGQRWFQDLTTFSSIAGAGGNSTQFGTTISALRILITVHDGRSKFRLTAVVSPQGGATVNTTSATNATAAASASSSSASTSVASTSQPSTATNSATAAAAASQSINYPFTILEMLEDDEIPQPPPAVEPATN